MLFSTVQSTLGIGGTAGGHARGAQGTSGMKITTRSRDGVAILEPEGRIIVGAGDRTLFDRVVETVEESSSNILINLENVPMIDSSGIGQLLAARNTVASRGGSVKLLRLPPRVQDLLQVTRLLAVFEVFDDEEEAVESFV